jgi:DDE_Tnp_1-associated
LEEFGACWEGLEDPRTGNATLHHLHDLLMIALCSVICGGENAMDMAAFAKAKEPLLRGFLRLSNGVPSHDTFSQLFRLLDPAPFGAAFQRFMAVFSQQYQGVVAIDGKILRRSHDHASGKSALLWSAPGAASNAWCLARSPLMRSRTRSPRCQNCLQCCR